MTNRMRWLLVPIIVLAFVGAWAWHVRRQALVWYTSHPVDTMGHRVRVLVPAGWEPGYSFVWTNLRPITGDKQSNTPIYRTVNLIWYSRPAGFSWSGFLRRLPWLGRLAGSSQTTRRFSAFGDHMSINVWIDPLPANHGGLFPDGNERAAGDLVANRRVLSCDGRICAEMLYCRSSRREFDSTHSAVCNSLRIE